MKSVNTVVLILALVSNGFVACRSEKPIEKLSYQERLDRLNSSEEAETISPESTKIYKMEYFSKSKFLAIYFQNNKQQSYLYGNVQEDLWNRFKAAKSKGRFYAQEIEHNEELKLDSNK